MTDYEDHLADALSETTDTDGTSGRFSIPAPELRQEGTETVYENFPETVERLDREGDHVLQYLKTELGTRGHVDETGRARLVGQFGTTRVHELVEGYADEYVICPACGAPDTHLERNDGSQVLRCDACGARTVVEE